ncbi:MAG: helix-turn-helix domain-containing protein [Chloroflexi bacterium]|nr:helix-turn-helix domain-containing protein [Chloroflexota bacterium]
MTDRLAAALVELVEALRAEIVAEARPDPGAPQRLLSVDEAAAACGVGRTALYSELASGRLRSMRVGRRRLIPAGAIADYIAAGAVLPSAGQSSDGGGRDRSGTTSGGGRRRHGTEAA